MARRVLVAALTIAVSALSARTANAQAWVPAKGEGAVAVMFQDLFVADHFFARGQRMDRGQIRSDNLIVDVTYGITDKLAVTLAAPFIRARYTGTAPHPTAQDDGRAHSGFQDVKFAVRYNLTDGELVITPFAGTSVPTHGYEYFAHASYGPRVREFEVGAYVGRVVSRALPDAFVQARYSYTFAERIVGVSHNRSNLDVEFGYFLTRNLRVFTLGRGHKTHGGIDVPDAGWKALPAEQGRHHDRIGRIELLDAGAGIQVSVTKSLDLFGSYMKSLAGRNTHALDRAFTVGASWSFGRKLRALMAEDDTADSLIKCLCQK